ncbi:MFS transporter, partial [Candidatus Liberibacter asiaticus]
VIKSFHSRQLENAPLHIQGNIPPWLQSSFPSYFKDTWLKEAKSLSMLAPLDLRTNTLKVSRCKLFKNLCHYGVHHSSLSRFGLRIPATKGKARVPKVRNDSTFQRGWYEIQDEGSQIVSKLT